uniref:Putative histone-arginine methyltransferase 1.4 n=1 Tax=Rhizophora mucronata TaxID=61149 RepID=A0A2P2LZZ8_RHIMU
METRSSDSTGSPNRLTLSMSILELLSYSN